MKVGPRAKGAIAPLCIPTVRLLREGSYNQALRPGARGEGGRGAKIVDLSRRGVAECGP